HLFSIALVFCKSDINCPSGPPTAARSIQFRSHSTTYRPLFAQIHRLSTQPSLPCSRAVLTTTTHLDVAERTSLQDNLIAKSTQLAFARLESLFCRPGAFLFV